MEQLTLEQEIDRIPEIPDHYIEGEPDAYIDGWKTGMKEGAEWQKEQYQELLSLTFFAIEKLNQNGKTGLADLMQTQYDKLRTVS